jgi:hypothetical protein
MKKNLMIVALIGIGILSIIACFSKAQKVAENKNINKFITHKEAVDTLRADSTKPLQPLVFNTLKGKNSYDFCKMHNFSDYFTNGSPLNGFFGPDNYRIEFVITEVKQDAYNVNIYHVKGKNRHKGMITPFEGEISIIDIASFSDPNIIPTYLTDLNVKGLYALNGTFQLRENPTAKFSGIFEGKFLTEVSLNADRIDGGLSINEWYYSENLPSHGAGLRYDGKWTNYSDPNDAKNVVWASDFFRFANEILKDFSYGEREVEINEKYRNLGWQTLWDGEEWWQDAEKPKM